MSDWRGLSSGTWTDEEWTDISQAKDEAWSDR